MKKGIVVAVVVLLGVVSFAFAGGKSHKGSSSGNTIKVQNKGEDIQIKQRTRAGNCTGMSNATMNETMNGIGNGTMKMRKSK